MFTLVWKHEMVLFFCLQDFFWSWISLWLFGLPIFFIGFLILKSSFLFPYFKYTLYLEKTYEWFGNYFILVHGHQFFIDMTKIAYKICITFLKHNTPI